MAKKTEQNIDRRLLTNLKLIQSYFARVCLPIMAYQKPTDIDGFIYQMSKVDMRMKAQLAEDLVAYLNDSENSIVSEDLGILIDGLIPWLTGSHFKVS